MDFRRACHLTAGIVALTAVLLSGCANPPQQGAANDPVFIQRAPGPGQPTFFQAIRYIDDDLRYAVPIGNFYVSPDGHMCFRGVLNVKETIFDSLYPKEWCVQPTAIGRVELASTSVTGRSIQLACRHAAPQCIREMGYPYRQMNTILLPSARPANSTLMMEHLAYLMGGARDQ